MISQGYKKNLTCNPTVILSKASSFSPVLSEMGNLNLNGDLVPFPDPLAAKEQDGEKNAS